VKTPSKLNLIAMPTNTAGKQGNGKEKTHRHTHTHRERERERRRNPTTVVSQELAHTEAHKVWGKKL
jgi:hypothetical protein